MGTISLPSPALDVDAMVPPSAPIATVGLAEFMRPSCPILAGCRRTVTGWRHGEAAGARTEGRQRRATGPLLRRRGRVRRLAGRPPRHRDRVCGWACSRSTSPSAG
ncbi:hypothetical protein [Nocardioides convexus]|uniref:hypothetical protein n=1 Tax=Nocardioides convexus TaxID=2712224 RepID=UPI002418ACEE|nr:hypothetical protein [Nocardioides convexus]